MQNPTARPTHTPSTQDAIPTPSRRRILATSTMAAISLGLAPALSWASTDKSTWPVTSRMVDALDGQFHVIEQGKGPAVLFCHGFPDTAETWRSQMQAVAAAGYRAVAIDMRGYGRSFSPKNPDLYTAMHITGDLVSVLDALSIDQAVIVGHDWGAFQSQLAALMRPDRFRALVSLSIPFGARGKVDPWQMLRDQGMGERYYAFDLAKPGSEAQFANVEQSVRSVLYWLSASPPPAQRWNPLDPKLHMLRPSPANSPNWASPSYVRHTIQAFKHGGFRGGLNYYTAYPKTFELMAAYKDAVIRQPALYIWGAADGLCQMFHGDSPSLQALREGLPNLVGQVRLENVGHWVQHEAATQVNEALIAFLAKLPARA